MVVGDIVLAARDSLEYMADIVAHKEVVDRELDKSVVEKDVHLVGVVVEKEVHLVGVVVGDNDRHTVD